MAKIIIVHGIGNQFSGSQQRHTAWFDPLCDGLSLGKHTPLPKPADVICPFYGDVFHPQDPLSTGSRTTKADLENATGDEAKLVEVIWIAAAANDPKIPGPDAYDETLFRAPRIVERALNALSRSSFLANHSQFAFFGDLKQVIAYLNNADVRQEILGRVLAEIKPDTRVMIGHSLGSVIAYEALCAQPGNITTFLTLGSPLGLRNVVFEKLTPRPNSMGIGVWPGHVQRWTNIAAIGDIVAAQKELAPFFGNDIRDHRIDSGMDAHSSQRYLNTKAAGDAIAAGLNLNQAKDLGART
jgi:hypothetical protein